MANTNRATDLGLQLVEIADTVVSKQAAALEQFDRDRTTAQGEIKATMELLKTAGVIDNADTAKAIETALATHSGSLGIVKSAAEVISQLVTQIETLKGQPKIASNGPAPASPNGRPAGAIGKPGSGQGMGDGKSAAAPAQPKGDYAQQSTQRKRAADEDYLRRMNLTPSKPTAA